MPARKSGTGFKVGDHVAWNSEAGHVSGMIIAIHTSDFGVQPRYM